MEVKIVVKQFHFCASFTKRTSVVVCALSRYIYKKVFVSCLKLFSSSLYGTCLYGTTFSVFALIWLHLTFLAS